MRGNCRIAKSTIVAAMLAVLWTSMAMVTRCAGCAPQGGTGRGNTNNSGKSLKKSARPTISADSLGGTLWDFKDSNGEIYVYEFVSGGKLKCREGEGAPKNRFEGTWRQRGRRVILNLSQDDCPTTEEGTITGNDIRGNGDSCEVGKYTWTAKRISKPRLL
ncbi:MAG: hypothetical protein QOH41_1903 [Blastocatellia bacterium]|nr:hypothetical protein [Blastocatellia bacterium]